MALPDILSPAQWDQVARAIGAAEGIEYFGTEEANGEPSFTTEQRLKRCYELAGYAVLFGDLAGETLVHGSIHGGEGFERIGHGWVQFRDGRVWEPVRGLVLSAEDWAAKYRGEPEAIYTKHEASRKVLRHGHFGRWHESRYP